jgi:hypothetical protein
VLDENKTMIGLISQTDLIRFLSTHDYKDLSNYSIGEWAVKPLVTCKPTTEASKGVKEKIILFCLIRNKRLNVVLLFLPSIDVVVSFVS